MEMIERYVYAVTRRLPAGQRADIERELHSLIADMLAEEKRTHPQASESEAVESVLRRLGSPAELAASYRGTGRHLIGPAVYPLYRLVLSIVLVATAIGLTIALAIALLTDPVTPMLFQFTEMLGRLVTGLIGAFGWVTLIFAAIERYSPEHAARAGQEMESEVFQPRDLPPVPHEKVRIKPADPIAAIVFTLIGMVFAYYAPRFVGLYEQGLAGSMVPLLNEPVYRMYLPFILGLMALGVAREVGKLAFGRWTIPLSIYNLVLSAAGTVLTIVMISNPTLFNPTFFSRALALVNATDPMALGLPLPQFLARVVIAIAIIGFAVDFVTVGVRIVRRVTTE